MLRVLILCILSPPSFVLVRKANRPQLNEQPKEGSIERMAGPTRNGLTSTERLLACLSRELEIGDGFRPPSRDRR